MSRSLGRVRIVTTEMVLAELASPPVRRLAIEGVNRIRSNPNVDVVPQTALQFDEAFAIYRQHADKAWSMTDCASFAVMRQRGLTDALAHDRHFVQAGFQALLVD